MNEALLIQVLESDDIVPDDAACPGCGENRMDYLSWLSDESEEVRCERCITVYTPGEGN